MRQNIINPVYQNLLWVLLIKEIKTFWTSQEILDKSVLLTSLIDVSLAGFEHEQCSLTDLNAFEEIISLNSVSLSQEENYKKL